MSLGSTGRFDGIPTTRISSVFTVSAVADLVHGELAGLEATVAKSPWIAGAAVSAADIAIFPFIQLLLRASTKDAAKSLNLGFLPLSGRYPRLAEWVKRMGKTLPASRLRSRDS